MSQFSKKIFFYIHKDLICYPYHMTYTEPLNFTNIYFSTTRLASLLKLRSHWTEDKQVTNVTRDTAMWRELRSGWVADTRSCFHKRRLQDGIGEAFSVSSADVIQETEFFLESRPSRVRSRVAELKVTQLTGKATGLTELPQPWCPQPCLGTAEAQERVPLLKNRIAEARAHTAGTRDMDGEMTRTHRRVKPGFPWKTSRSTEPWDCARSQALMLRNIFSFTDVPNRPHLHKHSNEHFETTQTLKISPEFVPEGAAKTAGRHERFASEGRSGMK